MIVYPLLHPQQSTSESKPVEGESRQLSDPHSRPSIHSLSRSQSPSYNLQGLADEQFIGIVVVEVDCEDIGFVVVVIDNANDVVVVDICCVVDVVVVVISIVVDVVVAVIGIDVDVVVVVVDIVVDVFAVDVNLVVGTMDVEPNDDDAFVVVVYPFGSKHSQSSQ